MADDLGNRGKQGRDQINVNKPHEVTYWTKALGCSEDQLRAGVKSAGVMATDVRAKLGRT
jgi:hypothetical protein